MVILILNDGDVVSKELGKCIEQYREVWYLISLITGFFLEDREFEDVKEAEDSRDELVLLNRVNNCLNDLPFRLRCPRSSGQ